MVNHCLALLLLTLATARGYEYECLTDKSTLMNVSQYQLIRMKTPLLDCNHWLCEWAVLLSTNLSDNSSVVYLLTSHVKSCLASMKNIMAALQNSTSGAVTFQKNETHCRDLRSTEVHNWRLNGYAYNTLLICLESLCQPPMGQLSELRDMQRRMCREYLANPPGKLHVYYDSQLRPEWPEILDPP